MADIERMKRALVAADKAGDTEAATTLAKAIRAASQGGQPGIIKQEPYSGSILPFSKDAEGNVSFDSNAGLVGTLKRAFMLPGDVMKGDVPLYDQNGDISQEVIGRSFETAALMSPASPASGLKMAAPKMARPKPEGLRVAEAGNRIGVALPRAAVSDKIAVQQAGKTVANVPIGGTPLRKASQTAIDQMDDVARSVQQGYGSGSVANAGSMAREGIADYAGNTLKGMVKARYDAVDDLVTPNVKTPLSSTAKTATDILARRQNSKVAGDSQAVRLVRKALAEKDGLNYQGVKDLRTSVGEMMDDMSLAPKGTSEGELKSIYASLSDDLRNAVKRSGGDAALSKWEQANTFAAKTAQERKALQSVLGRQTSDEGIFSKITAMAGSTSRADQNGLMRVRRAVSKETWDEISSAVISNLGRGPDGNFSPDRFVTSYGKLSQTGKDMLFKTTGKKDLAKSLDDLALVSARFKQLNQYANPSGTGQTVITGGLGAGIVVDPTTTVGAIVGSRVMANILAKPVSARKLANWAKAYEAATVQPSVKATALLEVRAKVLATELAAETGAQSMQLLPMLSRVGHVPADQGNENKRFQENKNGGVGQQPDNRQWF